jgi:hypothetical protein
MKYQKITETVDAIQWTGSNDAEAAEFLGVQAVDHQRWPTNSIYINAARTSGIVIVNDWIVKHSNGTLSVFSQADFASTYEERTTAIIIGLLGSQDRVRAGYIANERRCGIVVDGNHRYKITGTKAQIDAFEKEWYSK